MPTYTSVTASEVLVKQPGEKRRYSMSFASLMASTETIEASSPAPVASVTSNTGATNLTVTGVAISGQAILLWIADGTHGVKYRVQITITTSTGAILVGDGILKVESR